MNPSENDYQRGVLKASDPSDAELVAELSEKQVRCLTLMSERVALEGRGNYGHSLNYEQLSPLFVAQSETLAQVAFQIWDNKIKFPGTDFRSSKIPDTLHQIIQTSEHVRGLALKTLFTGSLDIRNGERSDLTRQWLTRYPDCADLAFEAMSDFELEGKMLEFLTSDMYRTSKYRVRAAEAVLSWPVDWKSVYKREWRANIQSDSKKRLGLLILIRDTIPSLSSEADERIRSLLRVGCDYCASGGESDSINDFVEMYRDVSQEHPEYEPYIWELMTCPGELKRKPIVFTFGETYEVFLWEVWQNFPERREDILEVAMLPPDRSKTHIWHTASQKVFLEKLWKEAPKHKDVIFDFCMQWAFKYTPFREFLLFIWEEDPGRRNAILNLYLEQVEQMDEDKYFVDTLKEIWNKHPEHHEQIYPVLHAHFAENKWDTLSFYQHILKSDGVPEGIFQTARSALLTFVLDSETRNGWAESYRYFMMERFPEERQILWEMIKAQNPNRATVAEIMERFPDLALPCLRYLEGMNAEEHKRVKKEERLHFAKRSRCYDFSDEWKPDYGKMGELLNAENADSYPCDQIAALLFDSAGSLIIEPGIEHEARQKILFKVVTSQYVSFPLRKKAWNVISQEFEKYGDSKRNWDLIWEVAESDADSIFTQEAIFLIYQYRSLDWGVDSLLRFIYFSSGAMRQEAFSLLLVHPSVTLSRLNKLAEEIPELAEQIEAHELPSVETIVAELQTS